MCLGIPMEVLELDVGNGIERARCRRRNGAEEWIDLTLTGVQPVGSFVMVHLGAARATLSAEDAKLVADALDGLEAAINGESYDHLFADLVDREPQLPDFLRPPAPEKAA